MTTPAIVIREHAHIAYAAVLMLKNRVHRLPVVDSNGALVGIVSRTDVFEPVVPEMLCDPLFMTHPGDNTTGHTFQPH